MTSDPSTADPSPSPDPLIPPSLDDASFVERARALEWLLLDVDGVLTDGRLLYTPDGEMLKQFHVRDGLAIRLAQKDGLKMAVISGRTSPALERRLTELDFDHVHLASKNKGEAFDAFCRQHGVEPSTVATIGDDIQDLAILRRCALSFAPADAVSDVRKRVHRVLSRDGGAACVREMIEALLHARGTWSTLTARYC